jgi:hypothetical protein
MNMKVLTIWLELSVKSPCLWSLVWPP